jgi:Holliday junction DNA helicase RuvA
MIEALRGTLVTKQPHRVLIETHGVAFELFVPFSTFRQLGENGAEVLLQTHLHWREEGPQLFGFFTESERALFRLLLRVNKVGPKLAVNIMSASTPDALIGMIMSEDLAGLTSLKGVGAKIASRLVVELRDVIAKSGLGTGVTFEETGQGRKDGLPFAGEVREALENLGYTPKEIDKAFREVGPALPANADVQTVLEAALRSFSR